MLEKKKSDRKIGYALMGYSNIINGGIDYLTDVYLNGS